MLGVCPIIGEENKELIQQTFLCVEKEKKNEYEQNEKKRDYLSQIHKLKIATISLPVVAVTEYFNPKSIYIAMKHHTDGARFSDFPAYSFVFEKN